MDMTKIYEFQQYKNYIKNKLNKKMEAEKTLAFEILFSITKYIYLHMEIKPEHMFETITVSASTSELFNDNRGRFATAFVELIEHWNLGPLPEEEIPMDKEFETFPTVEDLCLFVEEKLTKKSS
jgi:hypothetical protein